MLKTGDLCKVKNFSKDPRAQVKNGDVVIYLWRVDVVIPPEEGPLYRYYFLSARQNKLWKIQSVSFPTWFLTPIELQRKKQAVQADV